MAEHNRPNILLVMADQLAPQFTGAYGHRVVQTPNLDRLAERGVRFDTAYSPCPRCAPARACMLTGEYCSTNGVYDNGAALGSDRFTFAHALSLAGYDTALSGKMHFVGPDQLHGFRMRMVRDTCPADFRWTASRHGPPMRQSLAYDEKPGTFRHASHYISSGVHVGYRSGMLSYDEEVHFRATEYLRVHGQKQKTERAAGRDHQPFLLCVSYHHPHAPFSPPKEFWDLYEDAPIDIPEFPADLEQTYSIMDRWLNTRYSTDEIDVKDPESMRTVRRAYYALVSYVDHKLGQLLDTLREYGLDENTIVVFTSDHGEMLCEKGMVQKSSFYELSARVPLIFSFPDHRAAGRRVSEPVNLIDIAPTLCDMAGVPAAEQEGMFDGASLTSLIDGASEPDRVAFSEMHTDGVFTTCFMLRQGAYKYIDIRGHEEQLFDLSSDPGEWKNLIGTPVGRDIASRMRKMICDRFDAEAIDRDAVANVSRRRRIMRAMALTKCVWDSAPRFPSRDCFSQYLP